MSIRAFVPTDLPVIVDIGNRAWCEIKKMTRDALGDKLADRFNPEGDNVTKGREIEHFAAETPENIFICEENGRIVGFITFVMSGGVGIIGNNAVDPECGLKGIGQQMYRAVLEHFRKCGLKSARVTTGLDYAHAPARRAYERAGFARKLESVTYYLDLEGFENT